ncbi:MAG: hypothetical protein ABI354_02090 [Candidatus Saccharimonadales bacterium]
MTTIPNRGEIRSWSANQRAEVAQALDEMIERTHTKAFTHRKPIVLVITFGGALLLLPWIVYLSLTLPAGEFGGMWRTVWIGFDIAMVIVLGVAGWLVWHKRNLATIALTVSAVFLIVDAWFDVCLSWSTNERWPAIITALLVEIPVALLLLYAVVAMLRSSATVLQLLRGQPGPTSIWKQPIVMQPPKHK